ncbi:hypothetical protein [Levilactobacillus brevis]|uniref:hypothetical protein n=1 Tax=Levilactobacillus brevis TaxID=1580 RepID=UPI002073C4E8|nr:hypothetical protein [Levilactobacillus brevis]
MAKIMKIMVMLLVPLGFITTVGVTAQAKAQSTPKSIRGTWYQHRGKNKFFVIKITKNNVYVNSKLTYSTKKSGANKIFIQSLSKKVTHGSGVSYILNGHYKYEYQTFGEFWLSKEKISNRRVLKNYHHMDHYNVFTKNKIKHNYSYHKDSFKDIGR